METVERTPWAAANPATAQRGLLDDCLEASAQCDLACVACADACLGERQVDALRACIRLNIDCADTCDLTARLLARRRTGDPEFLRAQLEACARICASCGAECVRHARHHEPCRIAAEACRRCEERCREALLALSSGPVSRLDDVSDWA